MACFSFGPQNFILIFKILILKILHNYTKLNTQEALEIIENFDSEIHNYTDNLFYDIPNGGSIYLFYTTNNKKIRDFKADPQWEQ